MMKKITLIMALIAFSFGYAQVALPWDFETTPAITDVTGFDGCTPTVEAVMAPQTTGNSSTKLLKLVRDGGQVWAGAFIRTAANLNFATKRYITVKIWTTAPIGTKISLKSEEFGAGANNSGDKDVFTTVTSAWETLVWDFNGVTNANQNQITFLPNNGTLGNGSANSTFYFDDVQNVATLGTKDFKIAGLNVYPNPSKDSWSVKTSNINMSAITVYDILGKNVLTLTPNATGATINGSSLKAGLYFAQIKTANGLSGIKLVKE